MDKSCQKSSCSSADMRSSSKRLYEAVYRLIDFDSAKKYGNSFNDQNTTSSFENQDQQIRTLTNGERIQYLLTNELFISHLDEMLKNQGYYDFYPVLRIECHAVYGFVPELCLLQEEDILDIFSKFGKVHAVQTQDGGRWGCALFTSHYNAYVAYKILDCMQLRCQNIMLRVSWIGNQICQMVDSQKFISYIEAFHSESIYKQSERNNAKCLPKQTKFTCRYQIQIENEKEFQVARRIIGSKGCNMKKIIESAIQTVYKGNIPEDINLNDLLKLRLRGKGSGYRQGPQQQQSDDNLHLCVSAKDQKIYNIACKSVQKLLFNVYSQYSQYTGQECLQIKRIDIGQTVPIALQIAKDIQRIPATKISQLLQLRNKARRQLNFLEADRIRDYLRTCGVCLIDQKGRRGKAADVTTWKYLF